MKTIKIASLGEGNKSAYDAAGNRYFVPNRFRTNAKNGDTVLIVEKSFSSRTNDAGVVEACAPWTRSEVTFCGSFAEAAIAKNEAAINAGLEAAIVAKEVKKLAKEYSLDAELEAAAASI